MAISLEDLLKLEPDDMLQHDETHSIEDLKDPDQWYFDDIEVGMEFPKYVKKYSIVHFERWCIAGGNTHRLHYDYPHALNHDVLPGALFHGSWRMQIIAKWLKNSTLPNGWAWKARWQVREMVVPGEITIVWGRATDLHKKKNMGLWISSSV